MFSVLLIFAWLCVAAWVYLVTAHGRFWSVRAAQRHSSPRRQTAPQPSIAVVMPARNEADVIARAVTSLLAQAASANIVRIFVIDDASTDGTAEAVRMALSPFGQAGAPLPRHARDRLSSPSEDRMVSADPVNVIPGRPLPPGWTGKVWAVQQGVELAMPLRTDFLLLTDADIEHAPGSLATLIDIAEAGGYDLASFMVKLHCASFAEKLLVPVFVLFFFLLYPPEWVRDPRNRTAGAAGGCMLVRPAALERIGGMASIRQEIIDDCALAHAVKRSGGKVWLGLAGETRSLRPYGSFAEIGRMIARTAFNQLHHSVWLLLATVLGMLLLYVLPLALMAGGSPRLAFAGAFAYGLMTFAYMPMVRFYRLNRLWALTLPLAGVFYTAATIQSAIEYWTGRGGAWKGRAQDAR